MDLIKVRTTTFNQDGEQVQVYIGNLLVPRRPAPPIELIAERIACVQRCALSARKSGTAAKIVSIRISAMIIRSSRNDRSVSIMSARACAVSEMTGQFTGQEVGALLQLIFILKPRVEPLEVRPIPKYVGLFRHRDQARNALLNEQRIADVLQERPASAGRAAVFGQLREPAARWTSKTALTLRSSCARIRFVAMASAMMSTCSGRQRL